MVDRLIRQRDYLLDVSRILTSHLNLKDVLGRILQSAAELLGGQAGLIALVEQDSFVARATYGIKPSVLDAFGPLLSDIPRSDPASFAIPELNRKMQKVGQLAEMGLRQVIALPMAIGSDLVGIIYIFRVTDGHFTPNAVRILQSFADQAAIAVQNAHLFESVASEKMRLNAILQHSADGIMLLKPDLSLESINLALSRMTGWIATESKGKPHEEIIQWVHTQPELTLEKAAELGWPLQNREPLYVEGDLQNLAGRVVSVGITYAPLFNKSEELVNIIGNVRDITKFREAEEAKTTFVSVISHELKTPVSIIKGYASTLSRPDVEWRREVVSDGLRIIEEEADRLSELIENLLDATRLQAGKLSLVEGEVALNDLVERVASLFRIQTDKHTILTMFPPGFPVIYGDEARLSQVLSNLVGNAIKYSPEGGTIQIVGRVLEDVIEITVQDSGIGIPIDQQEFIFDRFYRIDNALSRNTQGAGLGLYIVRSIIEAHKGEIWIQESEPGSGTTFAFTLPLPITQSA
jgi:PAS domain S-box-containing protein